ncbi:acyl-CoA dehydrogenase family protein, partial [Phenylobacterium sp.]|uniref:acyl-CoA dehydrogenase family protein n=1 Tax=Phenylobacterium sp. TaxID=1871053 RepID=UPI002C58FF96
DIPAEYGGAGGDFRHEAVVYEETQRRGLSGFGQGVHSICAHYILNHGTKDQKQRFLPRMARGELVGAIAMTEPGAGSDLQGVRTTAVRDGNHYVVSGSKTYITNGQSADLIVVVAKTDPTQGSKGISLILVEGDRAGFKRGRNLDKIGQNSADTSELFFEDVRVPITNCLGEEGKGFAYLMNQLPQERLQIAIAGQAGAQRAFDEAVKFTKERKAFKQTVFDFQNTRFTLGALKAKLQAGWAHLDWCMARHLKGELTAAEASAAKLFHTELQWEVCDAALQLHGGAGYMNEYPIARLWRDARVQRIYGGTSEIMKEVVARSI